MCSSFNLPVTLTNVLFSLSAFTRTLDLQSYNGAAVVELLHVSAFKRKTRVRFSGAGSHIYVSFIFSLYISIVFIGVAVFRARKRTRVAVVKFHVSLYQSGVSDFCISFLSSMHETCVNIMT